MTYDIFTFFNELDLLEIRLNMLDHKVDKFVIIECVETFSGNPKPLYYLENKDRFKKWEHKIIHHVTKDPVVSWPELRSRLKNPNLTKLQQNIIQHALTTTHVPMGELHWLKEFYQKECIRIPLQGLNDEDICFVSDLDEIWNPDLEYVLEDSKVYKLRQIVYTGYMNVESNEPWAGVLMTKYKNIKNASLNHLRNPVRTPYEYISNGGWHFSFMGGPEMIKLKLESYGHQEFNNDVVKSQIEERLKNNVEVIASHYHGRNFKLAINESNLPKYLLENKEKYRYLFKEA